MALWRASISSVAHYELANRAEIEKFPQKVAQQKVVPGGRSGSRIRKVFPSRGGRKDSSSPGSNFLFFACCELKNLSLFFILALCVCVGGCVSESFFPLLALPPFPVGRIVVHWAAAGLPLNQQWLPVHVLVLLCGSVCMCVLSVCLSVYVFCCISFPFVWFFIWVKTTPALVLWKPPGLGIFLRIASENSLLLIVIAPGTWGTWKTIELGRDTRGYRREVKGTQDIHRTRSNWELLIVAYYSQSESSKGHSWQDEREKFSDFWFGNLTKFLLKLYLKY